MGHEGISESEQLFSHVFGRIGDVDSMMQVNFDLTPAIVTVLSEAANQPFIMLLRWIEIRVTKRPAIRIPPRRHRFWILLTPGVQATHLLGVVDISQRLVRIDCRLEVICHSNDEMQRTD